MHLGRGCHIIARYLDCILAYVMRSGLRSRQCYDELVGAFGRFRVDSVDGLRGAQDLRDVMG